VLLNSLSILRSKEYINKDKIIYFGMKYIRKISEAKEKPVTKVMWDKKMTDDQKETALLSVFEDPDDAEKWIDVKYDDLPPQASHMYTERFVTYPLANAPFHGAPNLGKEIEEVATNMPQADPPIPTTPEEEKKKKEEEDEEAEEMAATDAAKGGGPPDQGGFAENVRSFKEYNKI